MTKEQLIAKLTGVKEYTNTVSIDFVLAALGMLEESTTSLFTQELADEIANKIESCLDNNSDDLVDLDSAEFELNYDNLLTARNLIIHKYNLFSFINNELNMYNDKS